MSKKKKKIKRLNVHDFPDRDFIITVGKFGYAEREIAPEPTIENMLFLMNKLNEIIDHINHNE